MDTAFSSLGPQEIDWEFPKIPFEKFDGYWIGRGRHRTPTNKFPQFEETWLEIGAGSGDFFYSLAPQRPQILHIPVEICRTRGKTLVRRSEKLGSANFSPIRGNVVPELVSTIPDESLDRIYILYPCPYPKRSQRKHRWHFHPVMPHMIRKLRKGGLIIWASDQREYINEAEYVCATKYNLKTLVCDFLTPNPFNDLAQFPQGRTKFERDFLGSGQPSFELIVARP